MKDSIEIIDNALSKGIMNNPRAIGFAASVASVDLLSICLHKLGKISMGKIIEHQWFKRPVKGQKKKSLYERKIDVNFPSKEEVYELMCSIEEKRTVLAYGNPNKKEVEECVNAFWDLKKLIEELTGEKL